MASIGEFADGRMGSAEFVRPWRAIAVLVGVGAITFSAFLLSQNTPSSSAPTCRCGDDVPRVFGLV